MLKKFLMATALTAVATSVSAQDRTIRFSNWLPPSHPITKHILEPWAAQVAEATEGRVVVQFLPGLGAGPAHFDLVRDGVADAAFSAHSYTPDRFRTVYGMTLPGYANDATSASIAFWRTYKEHFEPLNEFDGLYVVGLWTHGPAHVYTRKKQVASLDDLVGLRLRATGGIVQHMAERVGVVPQFASPTETYELLSRGVVDGIIQNSDSVFSFNLQDELSHAYRIEGGLYRDTHYVILNKSVYDGLSAADREAIDTVSGEAVARLAGEAWDRVENEAWDKMEALGYTITEADRTAIAAIAEHGEALKAAWLERVKPVGIDGEAVLETFRNHIAELSGNSKE